MKLGALCESFESSAAHDARTRSPCPSRGADPRSRGRWAGKFTLGNGSSSSRLERKEGRAPLESAREFTAESAEGAEEMRKVLGPGSDSRGGGGGLYSLSTLKLTSSPTVKPESRRDESRGPQAHAKHAWYADSSRLRPQFAMNFDCRTDHFAGDVVDSLHPPSAFSALSAVNSLYAMGLHRRPLAPILWSRAPPAPGRGSAQ